MKDFDIYRMKRRLDSLLKKVENSSILKKNKDIILKFYDYALSIGLSKPRICTYLIVLPQFSEWLDIPFTETSKEDIRKLARKIEQGDYTEFTKNQYKAILKRFYKWLNGDEEYPEKVKWIKTSCRKTKRKQPEGLITKEELEKMIDLADHIRDKAWVSLTYESGFRIGEVLTLRIKHIVFDEYGAKIQVGEGKTGMRRIRIVSSAPYLANWIENHPFRDNPEAPLWISTGTRNKNKTICYESARRIFLKLAKRANIKKRIHPHLFRHTQATELASSFTEAQMNQYFGWVQGSDMPSTYVHLSGRDLDGAILKLHGLKEGDEIKKENFSPKKCHRCEKMNPPTGKFCLRCGAPLDLKTVMKVEEKRNEMDNIMAMLMKDLLKDPEIQARIENKLKQIKAKVQL